MRLWLRGIRTLLHWFYGHDVLHRICRVWLPRLVFYSCLLRHASVSLVDPVILERVLFFFLITQNLTVAWHSEWSLFDFGDAVIFQNVPMVTLVNFALALFKIIIAFLLEFLSWIHFACLALEYLVGSEGLLDETEDVFGNQFLHVERQILFYEVVSCPHHSEVVIGGEAYCFDLFEQASFRLFVFGSLHFLFSQSLDYHLVLGALLVRLLNKSLRFSNQSVEVDDFGLTHIDFRFLSLHWVWKSEVNVWSLGLDAGDLRFNSLSELCGLCVGSSCLNVSQFNEAFYGLHLNGQVV